MKASLKPFDQASTDLTMLELRRLYFSLLLPAAFGFPGIYVLERFKGALFTRPPYLEVVAPLVFTFSVVFAVALPAFYRAVFASQMAGRNHTPEGQWRRFERTLLWIAMVAPYMALAAQILRLPPFHCAGTAIMALYAAYYFYPSKRRIAFDKKIFRVK